MGWVINFAWMDLDQKEYRFDIHQLRASKQKTWKQQYAIMLTIAFLNKNTYPWSDLKNTKQQIFWHWKTEKMKWEDKTI